MLILCKPCILFTIILACLCKGTGYEENRRIAVGLRGLTMEENVQPRGVRAKSLRMYNLFILEKSTWR